MQDHTAHARAQRLTGIALMCGAVACFGMLDAMAKYLNLHMSTLEVVWARYTGAFLFPFVISNPWTRPELTVTARTHEVGESKESLPAPFTGDPLEIGFNADFLRDGLESVTGDEVRFKLISPLRPAVLEGESEDYVYLIMPIRLAG